MTGYTGTVHGLVIVEQIFKLTGNSGTEGKWAGYIEIKALVEVLVM